MSEVPENEWKKFQLVEIKNQLQGFMRLYNRKINC